MNEKSKEKAIKRIAQFSGEVVTARVIRRDPKTKLIYMTWMVLNVCWSPVNNYLLTGMLQVIP